MIQSVDRAVRILTTLQGARSMSLSDIAARLELPASTVHGLLKTLLVHGLVLQDRESSRYRLGPAVLRLGNVYLDTLELRSRAITWSEELARRTRLAVRTAVLLLDEVVIIHHEPRPDGTRQMPEVGLVIPAHACALGKALLAYLPEDAERLLSHGALRSMTGDTVTDPDELRGQLGAVRARGVATECDEAVLGEAGVAAPVFDSSGFAAGAIGIVLPTAAWPVDETVPDAVRQAARSISRELGASRWPVPPPV